MSKYTTYSLFLLGKSVVPGTGMMDMGMGMALGKEKAICTHTRATHIHLPGGYTVPVSNTSKVTN
jgi:hypothetical protein